MGLRHRRPAGGGRGSLDRSTTYTWGTTSGAGYGQLVGVGDASGRTRTSSFDLAGRLVGDVFGAAGLDTVTVGYGCDDRGRQTSVTRQVGSGGTERQTYGYDPGDNLVSQNGPRGDTGQGYDPDLVTTTWSVTGTPRDMSYPNGAKLRWDHDARDRPRFTYLVSGGVTLPIGELSYYAAGNEHSDDSPPSSTSSPSTPTTKPTPHDHTQPPSTEPAADPIAAYV